MCASFRDPVRAAALSAAAALSPLRAQDPAPQSRPDSLVRATAGALEAAGFRVDLGRLKVETKPREKCAEDLDRQQDLFFGPGHFEAAGALVAALGLPVDEEGMRTQVVRLLLSKFPAYYQADRGAIVLVESGSSVPDIAPLLAHELGHAWRDQASPLASLLGGKGGTWESAGISRCLLEGEAEVIALLSSGRQDIESIDPETLANPFARLLSGESAYVPYEAGTKWALRAFQEGGAEALKRLWTRRPVSTEQILHSEKRGRDAPTAVDLPRWPEAGGTAELVRDDVVGEMALYGLLLEAGLDRSEAWIAAAGWDGDRLRVYRRSTKDYAGLWRIACDREEDAKQLAQSLEGRGRARLRRRGALVDLAFAESTGLADRLLAALEGAPPPPSSDTSDGESTAAMEEDWLAAQANARVEDQTWILPRLGLRIPAPDGWTAGEVSGIPFLFAPASAPPYFRDNLNVQVHPLPGPLDVEGLLEQNESALEKMPEVSLDVAEKRNVGGRDVAYLRWHGRMPGQHLPLRFLCVIYPERQGQVVLTATVLEERWAAAEAILEKSFAGISFAEAATSGPATRAAR
ncbi:MAG: hypothetical protein L0323_09160 [Planctomycetes bacterium]|nr:hypothetical protein [Planctomycetota bacterium]